MKQQNLKKDYCYGGECAGVGSCLVGNYAQITSKDADTENDPMFLFWRLGKTFLPKPKLRSKTQEIY